MVAIDVVGSESHYSDANSYVLPLISTSYSVEFFQHKVATGMHNVITKALLLLLKGSSSSSSSSGGVDGGGAGGGDSVGSTSSIRSMVRRTLGVVYSIANKNDSAEVGC